MPLTYLLMLLAAVIVAAALTVWLFAGGSLGVFTLGLPLVLIAAFAVRALNR